VKNTPRRFYLIRLNPQSRGMMDRFAAYEETPEGLRVVWANRDDSKPIGALGEYVPAFGQVHSTRNNLPAYHYALNGGGYSKTQQIGEYLQEYAGADAEIEVYTLNGYTPSKVYDTATYRPKH